MNVLASRLILPSLKENLKFSGCVLCCTVKNHDYHLFFFNSYDTETSLISFSIASGLISLHTHNLFYSSMHSGFGCQEMKENHHPYKLKKPQIMTTTVLHSPLAYIQKKWFTVQSHHLLHSTKIHSKFTWKEEASVEQTRAFPIINFPVS